MNVESYFDECVANVEPRNLLDILITGHIDKDKLSPPGIYRMVFGGNTGSDQTWTDCGYEYDTPDHYGSKKRYSDHVRRQKYRPIRDRKPPQIQPLYKRSHCCG